MRKILLSLLLSFISIFIYSQGWMQYLPKTRSERELTFFDYQDAFKEWCRVKGIDKEGYFVENGERRKAGGWKQFKRWEYEMEMFGNYDPQTGAFNQAEAMNRVLERLNDPPANTDNISGDWVNLGYTWANYFGGYFGIGRLNTIAFHPTNPNMFWVGAPRGGIWATTTHGNSWTPLSDNIAQIGVSAIAIPSDYNTSQTIYIGTGDRSSFYDKGVGILKSTDGGSSWQTTGLTLPLSEFYVSRLLIHPSDNQKQYAGTSAGLYYTTNGWQSYSIFSTDKIIDMEFHPEDPDIIYYSTREVGNITYIKRSVDQGITWTTILQKTGRRTEIAVSPDEPDYIWAVVADLEGGCEGVYLSMDGGDYFMKKNGSLNLLAGSCLGIESGGQGGYDLCIASNPNDANEVWVGGINLWNSTNAGYSWNLKTHWSELCFGQVQVVHADQHWIEFQNTTGKVFGCHDGGVYYYDPQVFGGSFVDISYGLVINQLYQLSNSQQRSNEILMGLQDNSTVLWTGGDFTMFSTGDGINALINPVNDNIQYYTGHSQGPVATQNHWETSWNFITPGDSTSSWHKEFRIDPSNPSTVYFGKTNLWKSTNNGNNFSLLFDPPETSIIHEIAIAPSNPDVIIFRNSENIYKTVDGGVTWNSMLGNWPSGAPLSKLMEIVIKHNDPSTIWIVFNVWSGNQVFKTTNGGNSWTNISDGLPEAPIMDLIQDTLHNDIPILYAGGFFGVHIKLGDQDWIPFNSGLPNVHVNDLDIYYAGNKLRAATWGRGFWESDLFVPEPGVSGNWTGTVNTSWHDYRNWQYLTVPDGTQDVVIPAGTPYSPAIYYDDAICKSLTVNLGAQLFITGKVLTAVDSLVVKGALRMTGPNSEIEVDGDTRWGPGSAFSATTSLNNKIRVYGDWKFSPGAINVKIDSADVYLMGNSNSTFFSMGSGCGFRNLHISKSPGRSMIFDGQSTSDIIIKKDLVIEAGISVTHNSPNKLIIYGNLTALGNLYFQAGDCIFQGDDANIHLGTAISYFNNLEINANPGKTKTVTSDILIGGNLNLVAGTLNLGNFNLKLTRDLVKSGGNLQAGSGKLIFRGSDRQTISGSVIIPYIELAKPADTLLIHNHTIICNKYGWTEGTIAVTGFGGLMVSDLVDDGIYGSFYLKDNGEIALTQDAAQPVNLNGIIRIEGGNFTVNGGSGTSNWPGTVNSELWLSNGVLDFKDQGIHLSNSAYLLEVITGGIIRTSKSFTGVRNDFTPNGGLLELYGAGSADLSHGIGGNLWNVKIAKSGTVTAIQNLTLDGDMNVYLGTLDINGKTVIIDGKLDINWTLKMTLVTSDLRVNGDVTWKIGSMSDITTGIITISKDWYFNNGTEAQLTGDNVVKATGNLAQVIYHKDADASFAHFMCDKTGQQLVLDGTSEHPMRVAGDLTISSDDIFKTLSGDLIVNGTFHTVAGSVVEITSGGSVIASSSDHAGSLLLTDGAYSGTSMTVSGSILMFEASSIIMNNLTLNGTLEIRAGGTGSGSVLIHNSFTQGSAGHLILGTGSFIIDKPYTGNFFNFSGTTDLDGGFFEISYDGIQFGTGAVVNFNGGNLRIGGHFKAVNTNSFQPASGTVELINTIGASIEVNNGNYFHRLVINKTGSQNCIPVYNMIINDQFVIQRGNYYTNHKNHIIGGDVIIESQGILSAGNAGIEVSGSWINNRGTNGFVESGSSVWLTPSLTTTVSAETFNELVINGSTVPGEYVTMVPNSTLTVKSDFILSEGALLMNDNCTLNANSVVFIKNNGGLNANPDATNTVINCQGHWWDYNTVANAQRSFTCGQSTVNFKGANDQQVIAYPGAVFNHLNIQKTGGSLLPSNSITVLGNMNLQSGSWIHAATGLTNTFKGHFTISSGAAWLDNQNTVSFEGNLSQNINNNTGNMLDFGAFWVNRPAGPDYLSINSDISCASAIFMCGNVSMTDHDFDCQNDMDILENASAEFYGNTTIRMNNNKLINVDGGSLLISGDEVNQPLVTRMNTGYYKIKVDNGGLMNAEYATFEYLHTRGIEFGPGGDVFGDYPFNHCTLKEGISDGSLLYMSSASDITFHNVHFPANTWGGLYNVAKFENSGNVYLPGAIGDFAGPADEHDPYNRVHWPSGVWEGDVSTDWHNPLNWRYDFAEPGANTEVVVPTGATYYPVLTSARTVNSLTIEADASVNINANSLTVNTWSDIRGALNMPMINCAMYTDSIVWQSGSSANIVDRSRVYITGNMFIKRGSNLHMTTGEFRFTGNGESKLICHDTAQIYYLYNHKTAPYSLSLVGDTLAQLTVAGIFENGTGATLKCPSSQEWEFAGWFRNIQNGHFRCGNGTIRLTAPSMNSAVFRVSPGDYFHNLIVETPLNLYYTTGYSDTLRVYGDLVINQNAGNTSSLTANNFKIMLLGDWINNKGTSGFSPGTSKLILPNSNPQNIQGNSVFYYVEAGSNSPGLVSFFGNNTIDHRLDIIAPVDVAGTLNANIVHNEDGNSALHIREGGYMQIGTLIQGGLVHSHNGTLIVNDLDEDYIFGTYIVDFGLVELNQVGYAASHDLIGNISIHGGELRCTGGSGSSAWPAALGGSYANLTMTGGLFNLSNQFIEIRNNSFTENITGGTIRVNYGFYCTAGVTTFTPTGGAVEITTPDDAGVSILHPDSHFWDLIINNGDYGGATYPGSNFRVKNELKVLSGKFHIDGFEITVGP